VKNGVKRMVFAGLALLLEIAGIIQIFTNLNRHYELISLATRDSGMFLSSSFTAPAKRPA
jgi:hypothetical protein